MKVLVVDINGILSNYFRTYSALLLAEPPSPSVQNTWDRSPAILSQGYIRVSAEGSVPDVRNLSKTCCQCGSSLHYLDHILWISSRHPRTCTISHFALKIPCNQAKDPPNKRHADTCHMETSIIFEFCVWTVRILVTVGLWLPRLVQLLPISGRRICGGLADGVCFGRNWSVLKSDLIQLRHYSLVLPCFHFRLIIDLVITSERIIRVSHFVIAITFYTSPSTQSSAREISQATRISDTLAHPLYWWDKSSESLKYVSIGSDSLPCPTCSDCFSVQLDRFRDVLMLSRLHDSSLSEQARELRSLPLYSA